MPSSVVLQARIVTLLGAVAFRSRAFLTTLRAGFARLARLHRRIGVSIRHSIIRNRLANGPRRAASILRGQSVHDPLPHPAQAVLPVACWRAGPSHRAGNGFRGEIARGLRGTSLLPSRPNHRARRGRHWRHTAVLDTRSVAHSIIIKTPTMAKHIFFIMNHVHLVQGRREVRDVRELRQGADITVKRSAVACGTVSRGVAVASTRGSGSRWRSLNVDPCVAHVIV